MATTQLVPTDETNEISGGVIWEGKETLSAPANGNSFILPNEAGKIDSFMIALSITAGSGKVQITVSNRVDVIAGNAVWFDWDAGTVTSNTNDTVFPVSAIRQVNVSGTTKLEVRAL